jgi:hypothetical protein
VVVIVSGDGDFIPLVEYLQYNAGCRVEVMSFGRSSSSKLIDSVDHFTNMDDDQSTYLLGSKKRRSTKAKDDIKKTPKRRPRKTGTKKKTEKGAGADKNSDEGGIY